MILPFPTQPEDWITIWRQTRSMTLLSSEKQVTTITILDVEPVLRDTQQQLIAVRVTVTGGEFFIYFANHNHDEDLSLLDDKLVYHMINNNPKAGGWYIPQWYFDRLKARQNRDEP